MAFWNDAIPNGSRFRRKMLSSLIEDIAWAHRHERRAAHDETPLSDIGAAKEGAVGEDPVPFWDAPRHWRL